MPTQYTHQQITIENNSEPVQLDTSEIQSVTGAPEIENEPDPV